MTSGSDERTMMNPNHQGIEESRTLVEPLTRTLALRFLEAAIRDHPPRATGLHVTDISRTCLRQAYYDQIHGQSCDKESALVFWIARKIHETQVLAHHELEVRAYNLIATIDEYEDGVLIDKKVLWSKPPEENPPEYVRQLEYYMAMLEANDYPVKEAYILYVPISWPRDIPVVTEVTLRARAEVVKEMVDQRDALLSALQKKRPPARRVGSCCNRCWHFNICFGEADV